MKRKRDGKLTLLDSDLKAVLRQIGTGQKGVHPEIWARWIDIVGNDVARRAIPVNLYRGILTVAVANSSWIQQLTYIKHEILERLSEEVGPEVVREIRLVLDYSLSKSASTQATK